MAQFSHPNADSSLGSVDATIIGGEPTFWQSVLLSDTTNYVRITNPLVINGSFFVEMEPLVDPVVDTGHKLHITCRWNGTPPPGVQFRGRIFELAGGFPIIEMLLESSGPSVSFSLITYTLTALEVQAFRALNLYSGFAVEISAFLGVVANDATYDTDFIEFEIPDAAPPNPNEITGDLVLSLLDESEMSPLFITGDLEIEL